jgi:hypothetical protein
MKLAQSIQTLSRSNISNPNKIGGFGGYRSIFSISLV